jgi:hypothetical protein
LITPTGFGDKIIKSKRCRGFRSNLFSKGLRSSSFLKRLAETVAPVYHADNDVFAQAFLKRLVKRLAIDLS